MTKSQSNFTWLESIYQAKPYQMTIFEGYQLSMLN